MKRRNALIGLGSCFIGSLSYTQFFSEQDSSAKKQCPSFNKGPETTICPPGNDDLEVQVRTEAESEPPVIVTLQNVSDVGYSVNPAAWQLYRQKNGKWENLSPSIIWRGELELPPSREFEYEFHREGPKRDSSRYETVVDSVALKDGRYAFATVVQRQGSRTKSVEVVAPFEI
jgi:hypothetical protein